MDTEEIEALFSPAIDEIVDFCRISDDFVDREMFQIYIATVWGNAVVDPERTGIHEKDLSLLHDFFNRHIEDIVGQGADVRQCYEFIVSPAGESSMARLEITPQHKEFLHYFANLILSPDNYWLSR